MKKILICMCMFISLTASAEKITIYAAASTTNAVKEIAQLYTEKTGIDIVASFASSGTLAKQISNSAPADIFLSANNKWMQWLIDENKVETNTARPILANRLALVAPASSGISVENLDNAAASKLITDAKRFVIADPAHAPAGKYAQKTLKSLGIWESVQSKAARVQTVRVALAMVERNAVPLGIVYLSDAALSKNVKVIGLFDEELHGAIRYPYAVVKGKNNDAVTSFYSYLKSDAASEIFRKYGFHTAD